MFKYNPSKAHERIDPEKLIRFALSANEPDIASSSHGMQRARAYVVALEEDRGADVFVSFYFPDVPAVEYYTLPGLVAMQHADKAFERAMDFCASMGFVMEEMEVRPLSQVVREQLEEVCPLFHESLESYMDRVSPGEEGEEEISLEEEVEDEEEIELEEEAEEIELTEPAEAQEEEIELSEEVEEVEEEIELEEEVEEPEIELSQVVEEEEEPGKSNGDKGDTTLRQLLEKYKLIRKDDED